MAKTKEEKKIMVESLKKDLKEQKSTVFVDFAGSKAKDILYLRQKLRDQDAKLLVVKKTLLNLALKEHDFDAKKLEGQLGLVLAFGDELSPIKTIHEQGKIFKILGGIFEKDIKTAEEIVRLAVLPSKQQLLASFVGSLRSPISGFVNVLQGNIKGLISIIKQI